MLKHIDKTCKQAHPHMSHGMWEKIKTKHAEAKDAGAKKTSKSGSKKDEPKRKKKSRRKDKGGSLGSAPTPPMVSDVSHDRGFIGLSGIPVSSAVEKIAELKKESFMGGNPLQDPPTGVRPNQPNQNLLKMMQEMKEGGTQIRKRQMEEQNQNPFKPAGSFKEGGEIPSTGTYKLHKGEHVVPNPDDHAGGDPQTAVDKLNELMDTLAGAHKDAEKFDRGNSRAGVRLRKAAVEAARELKSLRAEVQNVKGQRKASKAEKVVDKVATAWVSISS